MEKKTLSIAICVFFIALFTVIAGVFAQDVGEKTYNIEDVKLFGGKDAKLISYPTLKTSKIITEENTRLDVTNYVGEARVKLKKKVTVEREVVVDKYRCKCVSIGNMTDSWEKCETCETWENQTFVEYIDIEPDDVITKDTEIVEVFEGCKKFGDMGDGWGCSAWTDLTIAGEVIVGASWWNSTFDKRRNIPTNSTCSWCRENTTVRYEIPYDTDMLPDYGDVRFVFNDEVLDHYIIHWNSTRAIMDVEIPINLSTNPTIEMYYNYSGAQNISDCDASHIACKTSEAGNMNDWTFQAGADYCGGDDNTVSSTTAPASGHIEGSRAYWEEDNDGSAHGGSYYYDTAKFNATAFPYYRVSAFVWRQDSDAKTDEASIQVNQIDTNNFMYVVSSQAHGNILIRAREGGKHTTHTDTGVGAESGAWRMLDMGVNSTFYQWTIYDEAMESLASGSLINSTYVGGDKVAMCSCGGGANVDDQWVDLFMVGYWCTNITYSILDETAHAGGLAPEPYIHAPLNATYWEDNITMNISGLDDDEANYTLISWLDDNEVVNLSEYLNGTENITTETNMTAGIHNFTVYVNDSDGSNRTQVLFLIGSYSYQALTYTAAVSENTDQNFSIQIRYNPDIVANLTSRLFYNGTDHGLQDVTTTNGTDYVNRRQITITVGEGTYNFTFENNVTYNNGSSELFNQTGSQSVIAAGFTNCSTGGNVTVQFYLYDEVSSAAVNGTLDIALEYTIGTTDTNDSFSYAVNSTFPVCIFPGTSSYTVNATIVYNSTGYAQRSYYLYNAILNNVTQTVNLYLLNNSVADTVIFTVEDSNGVVQPDDYVTVQRYYVGTHTFTTVAIMRTDEDGRDLTYLTLNTVYYRFIIESEGSVVETTEPRIIYDTVDDPEEETLTMGASETEYFQIGSIAYACSWNASGTNVLRCDVVDTTGVMTTSCLGVTRLDILSPTPICSLCNTSSSTTHSCSISSPSGTYSYILNATTSTGTFLLEAGTIDVLTAAVYGNVGLLSSIVLILVIAGTSVFSPPVAVIFAVVGLGLSFTIGLIEMSVSSVIGLIIIAILIGIRGRI